MMRDSPKTMTELRRLLVADSVERKRWLDHLVTLIRADERDKTLGDLATARAKAEREHE